MDQQLSALLGIQQAAVTPGPAAPSVANGVPQSFANTLKEELGLLAELDAATLALLTEAGTLLPTPVPLVTVVEGRLALTWPVDTVAADGNSSPQSGNDLPLLLQTMDFTRALPQALTGAAVTLNEFPVTKNLLDAVLPISDSMASVINPSAMPSLAAGFAVGAGLVPGSVSNVQEPPSLMIPTALAVRGEEALAAQSQTASRDQPGQHSLAPQELETLTAVAALLVPLKEGTTGGGDAMIPAAPTMPEFDALANTGVSVTSGALIASNVTTTSVTSTGRVELAIPQAPGQPGWGEAFAERVAFVVKQNFQEAEIRLNPPSLGQVEMRIVMNNDQASLVFSSPHGAVREVLEASLGRLRDMLADSGINLVNVDVSDKSLAQQRGDAREQAAQHGGSAVPYRADFELAAHAPEVLRPLGSIDYYV